MECGRRLPEAPRGACSKRPTCGALELDGNACIAEASAVEREGFADGAHRTRAAVVDSAKLSNDASFIAVATRVNARTFEYDKLPFANAAEVSGSAFSA